MDWTYKVGAGVYVNRKKTGDDGKAVHQKLPLVYNVFSVLVHHGEVIAIPRTHVLPTLGYCC